MSNTRHSPPGGGRTSPRQSRSLPPVSSSRDTARSGNPVAPPAGLPRRTFLQRAALGMAGAAFLDRARRVALAGDGSVRLAPDHFIPVEKNLDPAWVRSLFAKGEPAWYEGEALRTIGMPVGGIAAGQVYLTGDGRLVYWDIFNQQINSGYGAVNWKEGRSPFEKVIRFKLTYDDPVRQGFALRVRRPGGETAIRLLSREGFARVRFRGEYPIGRVEYADPAFPVAVRLGAFSPFVPLNARDSSLPATLLHYTLRNTGDEPVEVTLAGWLGNAVCRHSATQLAGRFERTARGVAERGLRGVAMGARATPRREPTRPPEVFADFEGEDYGDWQVEGEAFGKGPAKGTLPNQQTVSGFRGEGLVNTYLGGDAPHGRLLSPEFTIERPFISFLIGGGGHEGRTCINLLVDGRVVRTATGRNNERLEPHNWDVRDLAGRRARIEIVDRASGGWGHINIDRIEFRDDPMIEGQRPLPKQPDYGTMGLFALDEAAEGAACRLPEPLLPEVLFAENPPTPGPDAVVRTTRRLAPGETVTLTFAVTWHFPNLYRGNRRVGNRYAVHFLDAHDVARYLRDHGERLARETRLWRDTYYDSTLPWWLLDRLHAPVANLATTTVQWWENGRFWAWEGCGCCHGTCGHVWNYAQALARLFPELERSVREFQDFKEGVGLHPDGSIGFRGEGWSLWAGDAQGGYILKAYREHQCSPDDAFLRRNWPAIKRALEFLIRQDGNDDGLIEGRQHQTYDQNYYGPNTFVGSLYLGALRAGEEMARELGDEVFAARCRKLFESGRRLSVERLFNGQYFIQKVDLKKHPDWQYGDGCLADQLFGQTWAHQLGLGHLYPAEYVRRALQSVWRYNWAPDIAPQNKAHPPERWFASPGDAGLFTCTWPLSRHPGPKSTRYRNEIWTGIEYQVASNMAADGLLTEALAICRAIHDRYHPRRYNPWNEIECGDHYARALASWGVLLALAGFEYHGPRGHLGWAPRITPERFRAPFTAAEGWGTIEQLRENGRQTNRLELRHGRLRLRSLAFATAGSAAAARARVVVGGREIPVQRRARGRRLELHLAEPLTLEAGQTLEVVMESGGSV
ncbi:MAG: hypothetical protein D6766_14680 [Verrucomicrobia bacterium]|nr:MAG: hypothetical protein D6766_14680 [Verrucomicrobiota bacterium]